MSSSLGLLRPVRPTVQTDAMTMTIHMAVSSLRDRLVVFQSTVNLVGMLEQLANEGLELRNDDTNLVRSRTLVGEYLDLPDALPRPSPASGGFGSLTSPAPMSLRLRGVGFSKPSFQAPEMHGTFGLSDRSLLSQIWHIESVFLGLSAPTGHPFIFLEADSVLPSSFEPEQLHFPPWS
ncbi:uncharacterized protein ATNIH1004_005595 [Aspergillus tanneri]|uniref:Uncharacterized protein n=1 Tax=Aspergillus tanneri TaxID=1220188 RepID=A0A5M9MNP2_9EURO|nr:uncharacterized protein ATNIH1004_005595 [Aspergillus tanneri]KAA8646920.1 hypothetical protein ATNIH1004_005595 [Aspergillus tanneri]